MTTLKRYNGTSWEHVSLPLNVGMSPQTLGYAQVTADQAASANNPGTDLAGLSVTFTVPAGRRIRVTGHVTATYSTAGQVNLRLIDSVTGSLAETFANLQASEYTPFDAIAIYSPAAGTRTVKLTLGQDSGGGTVTMKGGSAYPAWILVEDITGSTLPYQPASVPVGQIGYAERVTDTPAMADLAIVPGISLNAVVPGGRILKASLHGQAHTSAGAGWLVYLRMDGATIGRLATYQTDAAEYTTMSGSHIFSPPAGAHTFDLQVDLFTGSGTTDWNGAGTYPIFLLLEDITPTPAPANTAPSSTLGYAESTVLSQAVTTMTALTNLAITVTVPAGRRLRITGRCMAQNNGTNNRSKLAIVEGAAEYASALLNHSEAVVNETLETTVILSPTAGAHTYFLSGGSIDTGTSTFAGVATIPAYILVEDITASSVLAATNNEGLAPFSRSGTLTAVAGKGRFRFPFAATVIGVTAAVDTAPTGAAILLDLNKNGTTMFTTQGNRPTIAISAFATTIEAIPDVTAVAAGDYLTVDIDQVGSTAAGAELAAFVRYARV